MRITKHALRRIIKEEKAKLICEYYGDDVLDVPEDRTISLTPTQVNFVRYAAETYRDQILEEIGADEEARGEIDSLWRAL